MMPRISHPTFTVDAPHGWEEIPESVWTLARPDGVGALQFSVAIYTGGKPPQPSTSELLGMVKDFARARGLGVPRSIAVKSEPLLSAAGSFRYGDDFLRVWQVSDGLNFAFVTYVCESGQESKEMFDCEQIVSSLSFGMPSKE
jgi:hypothetical protein